MSEVVIVITSPNTKEWNASWGLEENEIRHEINVNDINGFSEKTKLIVVNGQSVYPQFFLTLYNEHENINKYIVYHGSEDEWNTFVNNKLKAALFYSSLERNDIRKKIWSKVIEPLANAVRDGKSKLFKDSFEWLLKLCKKKTNINEVPWSWASTINKILRSFLPLDIDMQALSNEKVNKEKYLQEMAKDIDGLYSSKEKKNTHYRRKLYDLWYLLGQKKWFAQSGLEYSPELEEFTPLEKLKPDLCEFAGINSGEPNLLFPIHKFLESLDTDTIENKVKEICKPLNIIVPGKKNNETEKIITFHEWYIKLCEYLKEHEVQLSKNKE